MATVPPRVENKVIHHEQHKAKWVACGKKKKKKKGCWYGYGCSRVPTQIAVIGCPAMRVLRNLKERSKATLMCLVSLSRKQLTVPSYSSSSTPKPSKQLPASSDHHRNQAFQDCISYINSSTTSSLSSSSTITATSPPSTSSDAQTLPPTIATVTIPPPSPPPPHFSPISTIQNKSTSVIPSTRTIQNKSTSVIPSTRS